MEQMENKETRNNC
jgi:hypothetical protein